MQKTRPWPSFASQLGTMCFGGSWRWTVEEPLCPLSPGPLCHPCRADALTWENRPWVCLPAKGLNKGQGRGLLWTNCPPLAGTF